MPDKACLNCSLVLPAVIAETIIGVIHSSVDTWDQSADGTLIEHKISYMVYLLIFINCVYSLHQSAILVLRKQRQYWSYHKSFFPTCELRCRFRQI
ncbi:putative decarboxylase involved in desferrioxamine biosynthesis [Xenorhabdus sp. PB62.4]|nr:putative decarboxylase involved in desferrioxamine biosynthesis [Xenorhabdus sp. PB62.4]